MENTLAEIERLIKELTGKKLFHTVQQAIRLQVKIKKHKTVTSADRNEIDQMWTAAKERVLVTK